MADQTVTDLFQANDARSKSEPIKELSKGDLVSLVALNVQSAGKDRFEKIYDYLLRANSDVIVLSELKGKRPTTDFLGRMSLLGYEDTEIKMSPEGHYAVILRRVTGKMLKVETESLEKRSSITRVDVKGSSSLYVVGIYPPAYGVQNIDSRKSYFNDLDQKILFRLSSLNKSILLVGDFNLVEKKFHEHIPREVRESEPYLRMIARNGLQDVVRTFFPAEASYTWISPVTGEGQRLDHVYASTDLISSISKIFLDNSVRLSKISDHSAIRLEMTV